MRRASRSAFQIVHSAKKEDKGENLAGEGLADGESIVITRDVEADKQADVVYVLEFTTESGSGNCNSLELHRDISFLFLCWCQASGSIPTALVGLMFFHYTHVDKKGKLFSAKINDETRTVTILT